MIPADDGDVAERRRFHERVDDGYGVDLFAVALEHVIGKSGDVEPAPFVERTKIPGSNPVYRR